MPATIGSGTIGSTAIAGNPAAGQRGKFLQLPRFRVRVLDPVSGAVLIDKLPHVTLEYETIFPQIGMAGTSAIGHFVIHLFHPLTDEYAWNKVWYDTLDQMQRVEFYMVEDPDGTGATGDPVFTGIITDLPKEDFSFRVEGEDSLKLLDFSRTLQSDTFTGQTDALLKYALKTYQLTKGDDWTGDLTAYTNDGSWTLTTDQGFKSVKGGTAGDGLLYTTASYANSKYADCFLETPFHLNCGGVAGNGVEGGLVAALSDTSNYILGRAAMYCLASPTTSAPGQWEVRAEIWQKSGGSFGTVKAQTKGVITEASGTAQVTVTLQGVQTGTNGYTWTVLLNEIDSKCTWLQPVAAGAPTGSVGLRFNSGASAFAQHHFVFMSKANAFQPGSVATGAQRISQPIASQQNIDLLQLAASTEGNVWRKRPKSGLNNDQIDFGVSVGGDLSGLVRLEQDFHIIASQTESNAEPLNNAVLAAGHPAYNNLGLHRWYDIPTIKTRGLAMGSAVMPQTSDTFALRQMAQNLLLHRKQPTQAGRMTVLRHEDHAELPGQPNSTGMAYRDGDWVLQHEPRKGINYKRVQIMSAKVVGGIPSMELTLDQYPVFTDRMPLVDRLNRVVEASQLGRTDASQKDPATGVSFNKHMVLPFNPWKMRAYQVGAQNVSKDVVAKILYDTVTTDTSNGFSATNSNYTVPVSGYYVIDAAVSFAQPSEANQWQYWIAFIYVNSALAKQGTTTEFLEPGIGVSVAQCSATVSDNCYFLNAGDVVDIRFVVHVAAATVAIATGTAYTAWSMHLVSG